MTTPGPPTDSGSASQEEGPERDTGPRSDHAWREGRAASGGGPVEPGQDAGGEPPGAIEQVHGGSLAEGGQIPGGRDGSSGLGSRLTVASSSFHQGPLPTPAMLAQYEQVHVGLADRIVGMAERQQAAAIDRDLVPIKAEAKAFATTAVAVGFLPWAVLSAVVGFVALGESEAAMVAAIVGVIATGPRILSSYWSRRKDKSADKDK